MGFPNRFVHSSVIENSRWKITVLSQYKVMLDMLLATVQIWALPFGMMNFSVNEQCQTQYTGMSWKVTEKSWSWLSLSRNWTRITSPLPIWESVFNCSGWVRMSYCIHVFRSITGIQSGTKRNFLDSSRIVKWSLTHVRMKLINFYRILFWSWMISLKNGILKVVLD